MSQQLIRRLYDTGAVSRGNFTLTSGKTSDIYCDTRLAILEPTGISLITANMGRLLSMRSTPFDSIGCVEGVGSLLMLGALLEYDGVIEKAFVVRKAQKEHGTKKMVEGTIGVRPVLIDDVATSGGSLVHAVQNMPVRPVFAAVVLDRDEGATAALAEYGVKLYSILKMKDLREFKE